MSIYNGPSEEQFIELKRKVDDQYEQMLALRADIQTMIQLMKMMVALLAGRRAKLKGDRIKT